MTNYVVLKKNGDAQWEQLTAQHAASAHAAIRATANGGGGPGTYVAIPVRSFRQETAKVETKQVVTFS